jgi:hypothetical protein
MRVPTQITFSNRRISASRSNHGRAKDVWSLENNWPMWAYPIPQPRCTKFKASRALGLDVTALHIRRAADIGPAFEAFKPGTEVLFVVGDPLTFTNRIQINSLAQGVRLPALYSIREFVAAGGLMSYGTNFQARRHFRRQDFARHQACRHSC